jgi:hypothetical protein
MAYGMERGGVNIEHGANNQILDNDFVNNKCAVHLWWDRDWPLLRYPGVAGKPAGVVGNVIAGNRFVINEDHPFTAERHRNQPILALQLRDAGTGNVRDNVWRDNEVSIRDAARAAGAKEFDIAPGAEPAGLPGEAEPATLRFPPVPVEDWRTLIPSYEVLGESRPVGARAHLRGRDRIIMDEWGPWDFESPLVRVVKRGRADELQILAPGGSWVVRDLVGGGETRWAIPASIDKPLTHVIGGAGGVQAYRLEVSDGQGFSKVVEGLFVDATWEGATFSWADGPDPREDLAAWRALAERPGAMRFTTSAIDFPFGGGGPRQRRWSDEITRSGPGADRFGVVASTTLTLPPGRWRITTVSDDGVRVLVDDQTLIENWDWHGAETDTGDFVVERERPVTIRVEYFEIDGAAVLKLELEKVE